jgi:hypothetical protein
MKLLYPEQLQVDESKIAGYLLSHANGHGKALFFLGIGFRVETWRELADAITAQAIANPVATAVDSPYGTRYSVDGELLSTSGRRLRVRTVWILESGSDKLRLITAYPV